MRQIFAYNGIDLPTDISLANNITPPAYIATTQNKDFIENGIASQDLVETSQLNLWLHNITILLTELSILGVLSKINNDSFKVDYVEGSIILDKLNNDELKLFIKRNGNFIPFQSEATEENVGYIDKKISVQGDIFNEEIIPFFPEKGAITKNLIVKKSDLSPTTKIDYNEISDFTVTSLSDVKTINYCFNRDNIINLSENKYIDLLMKKVVIEKGVVSDFFNKIKIFIQSPFYNFNDMTNKNTYIYGTKITPEQIKDF